MSKQRRFGFWWIMDCFYIEKDCKGVVQVLRQKYREFFLVYVIKEKILEKRLECYNRESYQRINFIYWKGKISYFQFIYIIFNNGVIIIRNYKNMREMRDIIFLVLQMFWVLCLQIGIYRRYEELKQYVYIIWFIFFI